MTAVTEARARRGGWREEPLYSPVAAGRYFVSTDFPRPGPVDRYFAEYDAYHRRLGVPSRPVDPAYLPPVLTLKKKRNVPPIFLTTSGFLLVDATVRAAIERLEPETQKFLPVSVVHANGETAPREIYILNVHRAVHAPDLQAAGAEPAPMRDGGTCLKLPSSFEHRDPRLDAGKIGDSHLWVDDRCWELDRRCFKSAKGQIAPLYPCALAGSGTV